MLLVLCVLFVVCVRLFESSVHVCEREAGRMKRRGLCAAKGEGEEKCGFRASARADARPHVAKSCHLQLERDTGAYARCHTILQSDIAQL